MGFLNGVTSDIQTQLGALVPKSLFNAHSIIYAVTDDTPAVLEVAEQRILGRPAGGDIKDLTAAEVKGILGALDLSVGDVKTIGYSNASAVTATYYTALNLTSSSGYLFQVSVQANNLDADTITVKSTIDGGSAQEIVMENLSIAETSSSKRGLLIICARFSSSLKIELKHEEGSTLQLEAGITYSEDQ